MLSPAFVLHPLAAVNRRPGASVASLRDGIEQNTAGANATQAAFDRVKAASDNLTMESRRT